MGSRTVSINRVFKNSACECDKCEYEWNVTRNVIPTLFDRFFFPIQITQVRPKTHVKHSVKPIWIIFSRLQHNIYVSDISFFLLLTYRNIYQRKPALQILVQAES